MTTETSSQKEVKDEDLIKNFITDAKLQGLTERTLQTYKSNLRYFKKWMGKDVWEVQKQDLKKFLQHLREEKEGRYNRQGVAQSTVNSYFSALNSFYKFLKYEGVIHDNPIPEFRDRYLKKNPDDSSKERQLISVDQMAQLIHATLDIRNRAIILLLAKTGIRRDELIQIDLHDIDWQEQSIQLKPKAKRTNHTVFFDDETSRILNRWIKARNNQNPETDALFTNQSNSRLKRHGVAHAVKKHAKQVGIHDPESNNLEKHFTPHCCRHWFTTHLRRSGMRREFIKELRGDKRKDAIDIYDHIDQKELREAYLAHIPTLGV